MTEQGGKVGIRVQVPVLGVVSGFQKVADVIAGNRPNVPMAEEPVVRREMDAASIAAAKAATPRETDEGEEAAVTPAKAQTPEVAVTATPDKPANPPDKPAADTEDDETKARKLYQLGENYLRANLKDMAAKKFKEVLEKYPKTKAAIDAEVKLDSL